MNELVRTRLVFFLGNLSPAIRAKLSELKREGRSLARRPDFLWHLLLTSFATMGNSRGYRGLIDDPENYRRATFEALVAVPSERRQALVESIMRRAKIRMPSRKAGWVTFNHAMILREGGLTALQTVARRLNNRDEKISFLKRFKGIGDKYARNIWMDIYDPDFRDSVAIDGRVRQVSVKLGIDKLPYAEHEAAYQAIARDAKLVAWELDRTVYWFVTQVHQEICDLRWSSRRS